MMRYEEFEKRVRKNQLTAEIEKAFAKWDEPKDRILLIDLEDNPTIEELCAIVKNEHRLGGIWLDHHEIIPTKDR